MTLPKHDIIDNDIQVYTTYTKELYILFKQKYGKHMRVYFDTLKQNYSQPTIAFNPKS